MCILSRLRKAKKRKNRLLELRRANEAARRALTDELLKERGKLDWDRAGELAEASNRALKDYMDFCDGPGSYDAYIASMLE